MLGSDAHSSGSPLPTEFPKRLQMNSSSTKTNSCLKPVACVLGALLLTLSFTACSGSAQTAIVAPETTGSPSSAPKVTTKSMPTATPAVRSEVVETSTTIPQSEVVETSTTRAPAMSVTSTTTNPTAATASSESRAYDFSAVGPIVQAFLEERDLNGAGLIVVEKQDGIVHHEHWGIFGPDRISLIASSSKMLVAGILLNLHDRGLLDVDAPVVDLAGWEGNPEITVAQLLSNTSGLVGLFPDLAYAPYVCQFLPLGALLDCAKQIFTTVEDDADVVPPDTEFRYGGGQWQVAGAIAEMASGKTWNELVDEVYVQPCGLDVLAFNNPFTQFESPPLSYPRAFAGDPGTLTETNNPNLEGGAYTTTGAYGTLLLMQLQDGRCGDQQVLSPESLERMHADRTLMVLEGGSVDGVLAYGVGTGYGMGWWIDRLSGRRSDGGAYGSMPWLDLEDGYGAYLVVEATSADGRDLADRLYRVVETAVLTARG